MSKLIEHELEVFGTSKHGTVSGMIYVDSESDDIDAPKFEEMPEELEINGFTYFREPVTDKE